MDMPSGTAPATLPPAIDVADPRLVDAVQALAAAGLDRVEIRAAAELIASGSPGIRAQRARRVLEDAGLWESFGRALAEVELAGIRTRSRRRVTIELETVDGDELPRELVLESLRRLGEVQSWADPLPGQALRTRIRWRIVGPPAIALERCVVHPRVLAASCEVCRRG